MGSDDQIAAVLLSADVNRCRASGQRKTTAISCRKEEVAKVAQADSEGDE